MRKPKRFFKRAGRFIAGVNVLFNLGTAPTPPGLQVQARTQELQSQYAKNQKVNVLPTWRTRAKELGYQLREPVSGEYRPREDASGNQPIAPQAKGAEQRDLQEQMLSQRPTRSRSRGAQPRDARPRRSQPPGRDSRGRQGRGDPGR